MGKYDERGNYESGWVQSIFDWLGLGGVLAILGVICVLLTLATYAVLFYGAVKFVTH